jgi:hypothetical protein
MVRKSSPKQIVTKVRCCCQEQDVDDDCVLIQIVGSVCTQELVGRDEYLTNLDRRQRFKL